MTIVYGMESCNKCELAKEKLVKHFKIEFEEKSYNNYVTFHDGWREDGSIDVMAARCFHGENAVPLISHNGTIYSYPGLVRTLKS